MCQTALWRCCRCTPLGGRKTAREALSDYEYNITYAPSLYSFKRCLERDAATPKPDKLFLLVNPTQDLDYATPECEEIRRMFAETHTISLLPARVGNILNDDEVIAAMNANNWLHFSCHGSYDMSLPLQSKLLLKYGATPDDEHSLSRVSNLKRISLGGFNLS